VNKVDVYKGSLVLGAGLLIGIGLGMAILYGLGYGETYRGKPADQGFRGVLVGSPAPDFELLNLQGAAVRLSDLRSKPVLINFWATWCAPCVLEMPNIQKYYERYPGEFYVLAVNAGEDERKVETFAEDIGITFEILLDPGTELNDIYSLRGYPSSFFVDKDGIIQAVHVGMMTEDQIAGYLRELGVGN
jgi:thiol-disulfide isomerase/thioredoxin